MENRMGMRQLIRGICNLISPLILDVFFEVETPHYLSPTLELGHSVVLDEKTLESIDRESSAYERIGEPSQLNLGFITRDSSVIDEMVVEIHTIDPKTRPTTAGLLDPTITVVKTDILQDVNVMETEKEFMLSIQNMTSLQIQGIIFDQELPMHWHSKTIELFVRFWDFIFSKD